MPDLIQPGDNIKPDEDESVHEVPHLKAGTNKSQQEYSDYQHIKPQRPPRSEKDSLVKPTSVVQQNEVQ